MSHANCSREISTGLSEKDLAVYIACHDLKHSYNNLAVVDGINIEIRAGESVAIMAPSGAGKSTLLRLLLGLEVATGGRRIINLASSDVGAVFQEDSLLPWLTVEENIILLHRLHRRSLSTSSPTYAAFTKDAGLGGFLRYFPHQLSTGMKQKVALARLLLYRPRLYVLDEAMANLDDLSRFYFCDEILAALTRDGSSLLSITHNPTDALHLADRILVGTGRPLTIVREFLNPLERPRPYSVRFSAHFLQALEELRPCIDRL